MKQSTIKQNSDIHVVKKFPGLYPVNIINIIIIELRHEKNQRSASIQVRQELGCTATEADKRLEISDLGSRGFVPLNSVFDTASNFARHYLSSQLKINCPQLSETNIF